MSTGIPQRAGDEEIPASLRLIREAIEAPGRETDSGQNEEYAQGYRQTDPERPGKTPPTRAAQPGPGSELRDEPEPGQHGGIQQHHQNSAHQKRHRPPQVNGRVHSAAALLPSSATARSEGSTPRVASGARGDHPRRRPWAG